MIFILAAAMGMLTARWLNYLSLIAVSLLLAIAIGVEGAVHACSFFKVLKRGFEVNATVQGAYLTQAFWLVYGPRLLGPSDKR